MQLEVFVLKYFAFVIIGPGIFELGVNFDKKEIG
tara:strand:- start:1228 stop:1329 length:102 start_codon:yes stop_codon:yes gene_type:complete